MDTMMKASEIKPGDVLLSENGDIIYTVYSVTRDGNQVIAAVRIAADAGTDIRVWEAPDNTYVRHP